MRLFSFDTAKIVPIPRISAIGRDEILVWGMAALGVILSVLILWDAYLFYDTLFKTHQRSEDAKVKVGVSAKDVDEIIELLDERKEKFDLELRSKSR